MLVFSNSLNLVDELFGVLFEEAIRNPPVRDLHTPEPVAMISGSNVTLSGEILAIFCLIT